MNSDYFLTKRLSVTENFDPAPASPTSPSLTSRTNPLSLKVTSVLSASYADLEIKDALNLLDERRIENNAETRRQLRLNIQKDVIDSNGNIIREFGHVAEQLRRIGSTIASLNKGCDEMRRHIHAARQESAPVLDEANDLISQRSDVDTKQKLLQAFNHHFLLSEDEIAVLTSTVEPVNDLFFSLLSRSKKIQVDCEILLGTENQRLGQEIMDQISKTINLAFQKLYRWVQREFKGLNLENPQINSSIRRALRVLAERPSLFQNCLDFFAEARQTILSDSFYTALTGMLVTGEEDRSIKPIELVAHDPLRYIGDMLAWTHSTTVSEREALEVLFISDGNEIAKTIQEGRDNEVWSKYDEEGNAGKFDGHKALNDLVDRNTTGVARVLRQRIEQIIRSHEESITAYKIANLLNFYRATFSKLLGDDSLLLETFKNLEQSAIHQFQALMRDHVAGLQVEIQQASSDLGPPEFLQDGLKELTTIMRSYDTSFSSTTDRKDGFESILVDAFDPYMSGIEAMSENLQPLERTIFIINSLVAAKTVLSPYDFTKDHLDSLQKKLEQNCVDLINYQYSFFLQRSGVQSLLTALETFDQRKDELSAIPSLEAFQPQALMDASQILDDFLPSALMDAMENLKKLQDTKLSRDITEEAANRFCEDFEFIEAKIIALDEKLGAQSNDEVGQLEKKLLRPLFPRTSGEIRVLLS